MVPMAVGVGAALAGEAALPAAGMGPVRPEGCAVDGEEGPLAGPEAFRIVSVQHLDFKSFGERLAADRNRAGMDEESRVSAFLHVHPVKFHNEVFVHTLGPHYAGWDTRRDHQAVAEGESVRGAVDVHPAAEVPAVEHGNEALLRRISAYV